MPKSKLSPTFEAFQALAKSGPDPDVAQYFDLQNCQLRIEPFERYLGVASRGEVLFAKFLALVFMGQDRYGLDLSDVAAVLDPEPRLLVARWILNPIWP